jgi:hypothetical protein
MEELHRVIMPDGPASPRSVVWITLAANAIVAVEGGPSALSELYERERGRT